MSLEKLADTRCFNGQQQRFKHSAKTTACDMTFSIYLPENSENSPVLYWLSGLTCSDENFVQKAGAQRWASELGLILVTPDTSPRGDDVPDDPNMAWDFGLGASFYINATQAPWSQHYKMFDYVNKELPELIQANFPNSGRASISGHSMGGHGALISALHFPERFESVSAFAPIANPINCPWGKKAFSSYLGPDNNSWRKYDTCELLKEKSLKMPALVEQGEDDSFLKEQLNIDTLEKVSKATNAPMEIHRHANYDHSYFFISTFIEKHLRFHANHLRTG